jgi:hypothetical protein
MGMRGLKGMRGNTDQGICPICRKAEVKFLRCEGTRNWRDRLSKKKVYKYRPGNWNQKKKQLLIESRTYDRKLDNI